MEGISLDLSGGVYCMGSSAGTGPGLPTPPSTTSSSTIESCSDEELVAIFSAGDEAAFEILYRRYREPILAYLRSMNANLETAEDVYNEVMQRIHVRLSQDLEPGAFKQYLYRAAHNTCLNVARRESRWRSTVVEQIQLDDSQSVASSEDDIESRLGDHQTYQLAKAFLESLPTDRRSALLLYHTKALSYQEIASILEKPVGTVRWLIHEARAAMARFLMRHGER